MLSTVRRRESVTEASKIPYVVFYGLDAALVDIDLPEFDAIAKELGYRPETRQFLIRKDGELKNILYRGHPIER